jgi:hypothetical protein
MTHIPPQFRGSGVLVDEWRRRSAAFELSDAAAEVYRRCADELERLDVHTEGAAPGPFRRARSPVRQGRNLAFVISFVAAAVFVSGVLLRAVRTE